MNKMELVNEFCIDFITLHMVLYTDFCHNQYTKYNAGYSNISLVVLNILYNLYFPFRKFLRAIRLRLKKLWIRIPYWRDNFWILAMQSDYNFIAENAILLYAAWLGWKALNKKEKIEPEEKKKSRLQIVIENKDGLTFGDIPYLMS
jgi:hypothetical protein